MNKQPQIYLDTDNGALVLVRNNGLDTVDVYRCTDSSTRTRLGFLLCVAPNTRTLHRQLSDSEQDALSQYLAEVAALRRAEYAAMALVGDADTLACSSIMAPDGARMLQEAAAMLGAILDLKGFAFDIFAPTPVIEESDNPFWQTGEQQRILDALDEQEKQ